MTDIRKPTLLERAWMLQHRQNVRALRQAAKAMFAAKTPGTQAPATPHVPVRQLAFQLLSGKLGTKENPPNSNKCWATAWYGMIGPWCAMSVCWAYAVAGSKAITLDIAHRLGLAYVPNIVAYARRGQYGFSTTKEPQHGDLVTYDWEHDGVSDHVGLFDCWVQKGYSFYAVEGNTGPENLSNGGEVDRPLRYVSLVCEFVHVTEPK